MSEQHPPDPLTGLPTSAAFRDAFEQAAEGMCCVAVIQVNDFRSIADEFGMAYEGMLIHDAARIIEAECSDQAGAFRLWAAGFVVIVWNASIGDTVSLAERIRETVEQHQLSWDDARWQATLGRLQGQVDEALETYYEPERWPARNLESAPTTMTVTIAIAPVDARAPYAATAAAQGLLREQTAGNRVVVVPAEPPRVPYAPLPTDTPRDPTPWPDQQGSSLLFDQSGAYCAHLLQHLVSQAEPQMLTIGMVSIKNWTQIVGGRGSSTAAQHVLRSVADATASADAAGVCVYRREDTFVLLSELPPAELRQRLTASLGSLRDDDPRAGDVSLTVGTAAGWKSTSSWMTFYPGQPAPVEGGLEYQQRVFVERGRIDAKFLRDLLDAAEQNQQPV